jgi:membrane carboxypeptidase/penicillin-binding protein
MDTWFVGYTSRWMTTTWLGDDLRERPLGLKDAAFMLTVPMFARYMTEVTARQPLEDVPWERPPGVKANDTGGKLRTTMEEIDAETEAERLKNGGKPARPSGPAKVALPTSGPSRLAPPPARPSVALPMSGPSRPAPPPARPSVATPSRAMQSPRAAAAGPSRPSSP